MREFVKMLLIFHSEKYEVILLIFHSRGSTCYDSSEIRSFLLQKLLNIKLPYTLLNYEFRELKDRNQSFTDFQFHSKV